MLERQRNIFSNLRNEEKEALRELRDNDKITVKPADKGGAVVVMDTTDYIGECTRQLDNTTYYRILTSDPTNSYNKKIQEAIDKGIEEKEISSEIGKALLVPHPTPGRFYTLPKVHKEGNPGRPIIGGNGCPTEIISQFVDYHMKDLVSQLPSYVQDDMDFLRKIHDINKTGPLPPDTLLCTMDVSALYTNIPHEEGTDACRIALEEGRDPGTKPSPSFICTLIQLILTLNFFTFHGNTYLQTHGTAMGTCMAPTYANIFMGAIERRLLGSFPDKPLVWLRYIDDIFLIWTHGRAKLEAFIQHANTFHPTIKFTSNISPIHVPFLDVMVTLLDNYIQHRSLL